ncbi:MAG: cache domain-containing protein [Opitutaceae bacterium]|nr:cache domain-containing protein [Opitutaceae bacterium]
MAIPSPAPAPADEAWWHILDPRRSLRARAALVVGGAAVAFTVLLSWGAGAFFRRTIEAERQGRFESLAFQLGDKIDRALYERQRVLALAARLPAIRDAAKATLEARRALDALQDGAFDFSWLGVTDAAGRVIVATGRFNEGADAAAQPWFRGAQDRPHLGPPRERPELARFASADDEGRAATRFFDLAVPFTDDAGQFAGVIAAHVRWNWSQDVLFSVVPDALVREKIGGTLYDADHDVLLDSGVSGWSQPPEPPAIPDTRGARGTMIETPANSAPFYTAYARSRGFRDYRGLGWVAVVRQPLDLALAPVAALRRGIEAFGLALAALGGLTAWIVAGRTARRLRAIGVAAHRIRGGDVLALLPRPHGNDEVAQANRALDTLVEDWRAQHASLAEERDRLAAQLRARDADKR